METTFFNTIKEISRVTDLRSPMENNPYGLGYTICQDYDSALLLQPELTLEVVVYAMDLIASMPQNFTPKSFLEEVKYRITCSNLTGTEDFMQKAVLGYCIRFFEGENIQLQPIESILKIFENSPIYLKQIFSDHLIYLWNRNLLPKILTEEDCALYIRIGQKIGLNRLQQSLRLDQFEKFFLGGRVNQATQNPRIVKEKVLEIAGSNGSIPQSEKILELIIIGAVDSELVTHSEYDKLCVFN